MTQPDIPVDARSAPRSDSPSLELTPEDWQQLKTAWEHVSAWTGAEQEHAVRQLTLAPHVLRTLQDMLAAESSLAQRFEPTAARTATSRLAKSSELDREVPTLVGRQLGPYRVIRLIERGGMGAVYEARRADEQFEQRVAIKTLWRGADSDVLQQRFRTERRILAALHHPNIAQLIDGGSTSEGTPWLAMEFVEGEPIDAWCDRHGVGVAARLDLVRQACRAVQHAHQSLVIHRDLKPSNLLVSADGRLSLLDFGVAKLTEDGAREGTLTGAGLAPFTVSYAAPEQLSGGHISTAVDVWALGALLTTLLAGEAPRALATSASPDPMRRLQDAQRARVRLPSEVVAEADNTYGSGEGDRRAAARALPNARRLIATLRGELDAIVGKAMHDEPARRYASAEALSDDILRYLKRERVLARPDSTAYRVRTFVRRRSALTASVAGAFLLVGSAGVFSWRQAASAKAEAARADRATAFLSGIVTGTNATSYDPIVRLSTSGTLAELLDSALVRVPREFADDPRIRARLYTAIGANVVSQSRFALGRVVLDSAQLLAAEGFGMESAEYARASLEGAALRLELEGPYAADREIAAARRAVSALPADHELHARIDLVAASRAMSLGHVKEADSLAVNVARREHAQQKGRTILSLRAETIRMLASSWISRDPRDYLRRARAVRLLGDSLGLTRTNEQLTAIGAEFEALSVLGRTEQAAIVQQQFFEAITHLAKDAPWVGAAVARNRAFLASAVGDTVTRREQVALAVQLAGRAALLRVSERLLISNAFVDDALARGALKDAQRVAQQTVTELDGSRSPMVMSYAHLYAGRAALAMGDGATAVRELRAGVEEVSPAPDLASMMPRLRRVLADAYALVGDQARADSVRHLDPPRAAMPPCTPGGEWRGCPDK
ncbi:MAG: serine/threonine protein kinase [Gemmatimonadaceae bacterium]|nr:serine/threonine protein kinase [Gemmatimonadaceae bacterium]